MKELLLEFGFEFEDSEFTSISQLLFAAQMRRFDAGNSMTTLVTRSTALVALNQLEPRISYGLQRAGFDWERFCRALELDQPIAPVEAKEDVDLHDDFRIAIVSFAVKHRDTRKATPGNLATAIIDSAQNEDDQGLVRSRLLEAGADPNHMLVELQKALLLPNVWVLLHNSDRVGGDPLRQRLASETLAWSLPGHPYINSIRRNDPVVYLRLNRDAKNRVGIVGTGRIVSVEPVTANLEPEKDDSIQGNFLLTRIVETFVDEPLAFSPKISGQQSIQSLRFYEGIEVDAALVELGHQSIFGGYVALQLPNGTDATEQSPEATSAPPDADPSPPTPPSSILARWAGRVFQWGKKKNTIDVTVHYATDRTRNQDSEPNNYFGADYGDLRFGRLTVSIPKEHQTGRLERPLGIWRFKFRENSQAHVVLHAIEELEKDAFLSSLRSDVEKLNDKSAFVFVHGFNVTFAAAARRAAQISYDLFLVSKQQGEAVLSCAPILYSWPSDGNLFLYDHDEESVEASVEHLKRFIGDISAHSGASTIIVVAHSMGNRALIQALKEIGLTMQDGDEPIVRDVMLAAPDINRVVFQNAAEAISRTSHRLTLYASSSDIALKASIKVNGFPRLGDTSNGIAIADNMDSIDASVTGDDMLAHSYFGQTPVMRDMYEIIKHNADPNDRFGLVAEGNPPNRYWSIKP